MNGDESDKEEEIISEPLINNEVENEEAFDELLNELEYEPNIEITEKIDIPFTESTKPVEPSKPKPTTLGKRKQAQASSKLRTLLSKTTFGDNEARFDGDYDSDDYEDEDDTPTPQDIQFIVPDNEPVEEIVDDEPVVKSSPAALFNTQSIMYDYKKTPQEKLRDLMTDFRITADEKVLYEHGLFVKKLDETQRKKKVRYGTYLIDELKKFNKIDKDFSHEVSKIRYDGKIMGNDYTIHSFRVWARILEKQNSPSIENAARMRILRYENLNSLESPDSKSTLLAQSELETLLASQYYRLWSINKKKSLKTNKPSKSTLNFKKTVSEGEKKRQDILSSFSFQNNK